MKDAIRDGGARGGARCREEIALAVASGARHIAAAAAPALRQRGARRWALYAIVRRARCGARRAAARQQRAERHGERKHITVYASALRLATITTSLEKRRI